MSRSYNQSRHAYHGRDIHGSEVWSKRCHLVNQWDYTHPRCKKDVKHITAKYERRRARSELRDIRKALAIEEM